MNYFRVKRSIEADGLSSFRIPAKDDVNIKLYTNLCCDNLIFNQIIPIKSMYQFSFSSQVVVFPPKKYHKISEIAALSYNTIC